MQTCIKYDKVCKFVLKNQDSKHTIAKPTKAPDFIFRRNFM